MRSPTTHRVAGLLLLMCVAVGMDARAADRLYDDLGGADGVAALVDQFLGNLADDARINHFFAETNLERFRSKLIEHLCALAGGPCTYSGDSMHQVHAGLGIGEAAFNAVVEDLIEAMERRDIGTGTQNRLLALLAPMHGDIVERR
ncbi:MAG: group 1 truncated hemoglobin [Gammaproteobacteria bacterium]|jgi:hemoglobin|nr:group 1 truncated hemoglobin [Gammaproteobacteria bacterium]